MNNRYIVIMAGGRGERFWPKSRLKKPKHLLPIVGKEPMLLQTLNRLGHIVPKENILIITNQEQLNALAKLCPQFPPQQIIAEPLGKDTAAAIGLAKVLIKKRDPNAVFAVLPADHVINDVESFQKCLNAAFEIALKNNVLITLGIPPKNPSTAYGYIKKGDSDGTLFKVDKFVEKPNLETAKQYLKSGDYFWNAGMFVWSIPAFEAALNLHCPELFKGLSLLENSENLENALTTLYKSLPKISIDYALLEKAKNIVVMPASFDWDDVGEWPAIARHTHLDANNNAISGDAIISQGTGNIIVNENGHLTALMGVDNLIIIQTDDATLICHKDKAQDIKNLLAQISKNPKYTHLI